MQESNAARFGGDLPETNPTDDLGNDIYIDCRELMENDVGMVRPMLRKNRRRWEKHRLARRTK
jgi:hypothetical protein